VFLIFLAIVLCVLRITASDYPFGIFKRSYTCVTVIFTTISEIYYGMSLSMVFNAIFKQYAFYIVVVNLCWRKPSNCRTLLRNIITSKTFGKYQNRSRTLCGDKCWLDTNA